jgi:hypothetical protein
VLVFAGAVLSNGSCFFLFLSSVCRRGGRWTARVPEGFGVLILPSSVFLPPSSFFLLPSSFFLLPSSFFLPPSFLPSFLPSVFLPSFFLLPSSF